MRQAGVAGGDIASRRATRKETPHARLPAFRIRPAPAVHAGRRSHRALLGALRQRHRRPARRPRRPASRRPAGTPRAARLRAARRPARNRNPGRHGGQRLQPGAAGRRQRRDPAGKRQYRFPAARRPRGVAARGQLGRKPSRHQRHRHGADRSRRAARARRRTLPAAQPDPQLPRGADPFAARRHPRRAGYLGRRRAHARLCAEPGQHVRAPGCQPRHRTGRRALPVPGLPQAGLAARFGRTRAAADRGRTHRRRQRCRRRAAGRHLARAAGPAAGRLAGRLARRRAHARPRPYATRRSLPCRAAPGRACALAARAPTPAARRAGAGARGNAAGAGAGAAGRLRTRPARARRRPVGAAAR